MNDQAMPGCTQKASVQKRIGRKDIVIGYFFVSTRHILCPEIIIAMGIESRDMAVNGIHSSEQNDREIINVAVPIVINRKVRQFRHLLNDLSDHLIVDVFCPHIIIVIGKRDHTCLPGSLIVLGKQVLHMKLSV